MKKENFMRGVMLFWTLFIGIGAVAGAVVMLVAPDGSAMGMQTLIPYFQVLPFANILFQNFIFPGFSLLIVNGISNLTAAFFIFRMKICGAYLGCIFGITLMLWITIQFVIFPRNFMSILYFHFGLLQALSGLWYIILIKQNSFTVNPTDYKNIGNNKSILVVYFSRLGYTKSVAFQKANELGADIYEIKTDEPTQGIPGFLWLGRFGMHRWAMPIIGPDCDVTKYDKVIIVTPVYVFTIAPPTLGFIETCKGKIKNADYISVHFCGLTFPHVFDRMDEVIGIKAQNRESVVCRFGTIVRRKKLIKTK